jgi:Arc/MetJ-type ribon-helix-helix transcriptional regulator
MPKTEEQPLKIELTPDAAHWVRTEVESGRFATPEDAVRYAINQTKRAELRDMLDASEAAGGEHSSADVRRYVREHLDRGHS